MLVGLIAGLATGALWGLTFVAPRAIRPFTELDLAIARYAIFGLISLGLMILPRFRPVRLTARLFATACFSAVSAMSPIMSSQRLQCVMQVPLSHRW